MRYIYSFVIIPAIMSAVFFSFSSAVRAQNVTLSITPPIVEVTIKPGKSVLIAYTVSNLGDPTTLTSGVLPFQVSGALGNMTIAEEFSGPVRFELDNSNIALGEPFFLDSRKGQQLLLQIRVPEGTPEGDYYYSFLTSTSTGKPLEGSTAAQSIGSIGSPILITVTETGVVDIQGSIGEFSVLPRYSFSLFGKKVALFESTDVIPVRLTIQNHGRNLIKPYGSITLKGNFGERAEFGIVPLNILSQSTRPAQASPSAQLVAGLGDDPISLVIDGFFIGKYSLEASVNFGEGTPLIQAHTEFYAIPFKLVAATIIALAIGIMLVRKMGKENG
jgi:hypothetical protein